MKVRLNMVISECCECPWHRWEENNSCSNRAGSSECRKAGRRIADNDKRPPIPKWCPLVPRKGGKA